MVILGRDDVQGIDEELIGHADDRAKDRKERVGKQIDVDYMRKLGNWLQQRPWEGTRRVAVLVDAERMNVQAANAFLKSLEEPAMGAVVFLTSSAPVLPSPHHSLPLRRDSAFGCAAEPDRGPSHRVGRRARGGEGARPCLGREPRPRSRDSSPSR